MAIQENDLPFNSAGHFIVGGDLNAVTAVMTLATLDPKKWPVNQSYYFWYNVGDPRNTTPNTFINSPVLGIDTKGKLHCFHAHDIRLADLNEAMLNNLGADAAPIMNLPLQIKREKPGILIPDCMPSQEAALMQLMGMDDTDRVTMVRAWIKIRMQEEIALARQFMGFRVYTNTY